MVHLPRKKRYQVSGDTTVVPVSVAYPTDVSLMGKAARKLLNFAKAGSKNIAIEGKMLSVINQFSKKRKHTKEAIKTHLQAVVSFAASIVYKMKKAKTTLSRNGRITFHSIEKLIAQQLEKLEGGHIANRIVSIDKPYLRPIVRGKAKVAIEFGLKSALVCIGQKILMSTKTGYENFSDALIEKQQVKKYRNLSGRNPTEYSFDRGGDSQSNHRYLNNQGIVDGIQCRGKEKRALKEPIRKRLYKQRTHIERNIGHLKQSFRCDEINYKKENNKIRLSMAIMLHNFSTY